MGIGMDKWRFEVRNQGVTEDWEYLAQKVQGTYQPSFQKGPHDPPWNLNPDYQRGPVWTTQQQSRFIGHVLSGGVQPPLYVQRYESKKFSPIKEYWTLPEEVIDGQQRLRAIVAFMQGSIPAEVFHDGEWHSYWLKDMEPREQRTLDSIIVYLDLSREDRLRFYLRLNTGGSPHSEEELDKVRRLLIKETGTGE